MSMPPRNNSKQAELVRAAMPQQGMLLTSLE